MPCSNSASRSSAASSALVSSLYQRHRPDGCGSWRQVMPSISCGCSSSGGSPRRSRGSLPSTSTVRPWQLAARSARIFSAPCRAAARFQLRLLSMLCRSNARRYCDRVASGLRRCSSLRSLCPLQPGGYGYSACRGSGDIGLFIARSTGLTLPHHLPTTNSQASPGCAAK